MPRGDVYERRLKNKLDDLENTISLRVTGSGTHPMEFCDVVCITRDNVYLIEVKSRSDKYYLSEDKKELNTLVKRALSVKVFPILAVRFKGRGAKKWVLEDLRVLKGNIKKITRGYESTLFLNNLI